MDDETYLIMEWQAVEVTQSVDHWPTGYTEVSFRFTPEVGSPWFEIVSTN